MSQALVVGLPTAIVSAALYGVAPLVQARAARREEESTGLGLALLAQLVLRPLWLVGLAVEAGSFLLEVYALSVAPVAMVAPVMALDMIVFTLLAQRVLGEKISRTGWLGVASMVGGVALLAYAFAQGAVVGRPASTDVLLAFLVLGLIFALVCAYAANQAADRNRIAGAALGFGAAAGVSYAIATLATRQIGLAVNDRRAGESALGELLTTPTPYVLVLFSVLALGLQQRGLQGRAAVIAFPVTSGVSAFLPVTLGLTLFGEPAPGGIRRVALIVAMVMVAAGIAALGRDRMAANRSVDELEGSGPDASDPPEPPAERAERAEMHPGGIEADTLRLGDVRDLRRVRGLVRGDASGDGPGDGRGVREARDVRDVRGVRGDGPEDVRRGVGDHDWSADDVPRSTDNLRWRPGDVHREAEYGGGDYRGGEYRDGEYGGGDYRGGEHGGGEHGGGEYRGGEDGRHGLPGEATSTITGGSGRWVGMATGDRATRRT